MPATGLVALLMLFPEHVIKALLSKLTELAPTGGDGQEVMVVSGLPRSGTSLMMQMLEAGGVPILSDGVRTRDTDNPRGYYEFERVKGLKDGDTEWLEKAVGHAVKVVSAHLRSLPEGYEYPTIFMNRDIEEVLASQEKMLAHREECKKVDDEQMARTFEKHLQEVRDWVSRQPNFSCLDLEFKDVIKNPLSAAERVAGFLDRDLETSEMAKVVDPDLYRNRAAEAGSGPNEE